METLGSKTLIFFSQLIVAGFLFFSCDKADNTGNALVPTKASLCTPDTVYVEGGRTAYENNDCVGEGNECLPKVVVRIRRDAPCEEVEVVNSLENASQSEKRNIISENSDFFVSIFGEDIYQDYVINMIYNLDLNIVSYVNDEIVYHFVFNNVLPESLAFVIPVAIQTGNIQ